MKVLSLLSLAALWTPTSATVDKTAAAATATTGDKTIKKVVKLLENMLEKSKTEAAEEKEAYAKYKCYCDDNKREKTDSIRDLGNEIEFLGSKITQLTAENGELSQECMKLSTQMTQNEATRKESESLRDQSHEAFLEQESDMESAIDGFKEAIDVLAEIGGNSFLAEPDSTKFMAGHKEALVARKTMSQANLAKIQTTVRSVLGAASSKLTPEQRASVQGFLQSPATGVVAQSGAIVGILKQMLETFKDNLDGAKDAEKMEKKSQKKYVKDLKEEHELYSDTKNDKVEIMGGNDEDLATKKTQKEEAETQLEDDKEFLEKLITSCETKEKEYKKRKMLRTNEEAAIAEAVSILDSDESFAAFGKTAPTSTGATSFLQMVSSQQAVAMRGKAMDILQDAARSTKSMRLIKVAMMLEKKNPFNKVIEEIEKMLKLIVEEGEADQKQLDWCDSERESNDSELEKRTDQIETLEGEIDDLDDQINNPETGLIAQIKGTEEDITENHETQASETKTRNEEHAVYLEETSNCKSAEAILKKAIHVLQRYYDAQAKHLEESFLQVSEEPAPPDADFNAAGQSEKGNEVLDMLNFIKDETEKERETIQEDEDDAQSDFDSSIESLKGELENLEDSLASLNEDLAEKKKSFATKKVDLKDTKHAKKAIEKYIKELEPGCDFITENFDLRNENRDTETAALEKADALIKDTPAYKKFEEEK